MPSRVQLTNGAASLRPGYPGGVPTTYPVGWTADGPKLAILEHTFTDGRGTDGVFFIFDVVSGKSLVKLSAEESPKDQQFPTAQKPWDEKHYPISERMSKYKIKQTFNFDFHKGETVMLKSGEFTFPSSYILETGKRYTSNRKPWPGFCE